MPIYEYRCEACDHYLDALEKISDAPLRDCPACSKSTLKRLISAPSFRLKGSGWYETDFKSDQESKRNLVDSGSSEGGDKAKQDTSDKPKEAAKSDAKSDAKTTTSSESKPPPNKAKGTGTGTEAA